MPQRNQGQGRQGGEAKSKGRGFAGMDPQTQRLIASQGGRAAHASGHAHEFTPEEAREAGRKGGEARSQVGRQRAPGRMPGPDRDIQPEGEATGRTGAASMAPLDGGSRR